MNFEQTFEKFLTQERGAEVLISAWVDNTGKGNRSLSCKYDAHISLSNYSQIIIEVLTRESIEPYWKTFSLSLRARYPQLQDLIKDLFERGFIQEAMVAKRFFDENPYYPE